MNENEKREALGLLDIRIGHIVTLDAGRRRYLVISVDPHGPTFGLRALTGGDRESAPSSVKRARLTRVDVPLTFGNAERKARALTGLQLHGVYSWKHDGPTWFVDTLGALISAVSGAPVAA